MIKRCVTILLIAAWATLPLYGQSKGGRWQMEGNGDDSASWDSQNDSGILQGAATWSSLAPLPEGGSCLWLDRANEHDYIKIEDSADLDFENEEVGISMWIYPTVLNDVHFLVNKGRQTDAAKSTCYALRISMAKKIEFLIRDSNNKAQTAASGFTVPLNQWTFVAAFYDYTAGRVYFWNGLTTDPVDSANFKFNYLANDGPLSIGSWYRDDPAAPSIKDFQGGIDDVRISGRRQDLIPLTSSVTSRVVAAMHPSELVVWPNPVSLEEHGVITLSGATPLSRRASIKLYNLRGQLLMEQEANRWPCQLRLCDGECAKLPAGLYLVQIESEKGIRSQRLTILR